MEGDHARHRSFDAFSINHQLLTINYAPGLWCNSSISPCEGDGPGANPGFLTNSFFAGPLMVASQVFGRHWLNVRPLPEGQLKSPGRGWPGAAMQKQASSSIHFKSPYWMVPLQAPPRL